MRIKVILSLVILSSGMRGQIDIPQMDTLYARQMQINKNGMKVLGGWALGNMVWGGIMMTQTEGATQSFHQTNVVWNGVNVAIAGLGYYGAMRKKSNPSFEDVRKINEKTRQSLLFNAGLDLGYMALGGWLIERSKRDMDNREMLEGAGWSLVLQGGFLFTFDLLFYGVQNRFFNRNFSPILERIEVRGNGLIIKLD